jgi:hypothetical protein
MPAFNAIFGTGERSGACALAVEADASNRMLRVRNLSAAFMAASPESARSRHKRYGFPNRRP